MPVMERLDPRAPQSTPPTGADAAVAIALVDLGDDDGWTTSEALACELGVEGNEAMSLGGWLERAERAAHVERARVGGRTAWRLTDHGYWQLAAPNARGGSPDTG